MSEPSNKDDPTRKDTVIGCLGFLVIIGFVSLAVSKCSSASSSENSTGDNGALATADAANGSLTEDNKNGTNNKIANAAFYIDAIKRDMHDPSSLRLQDVRFADDGTFCAQLRGKNAFGAVVLDTVVIHKFKELRGDSAVRVYDRYCADSPELSAEVAPLVGATLDQ